MNEIDELKKLLQEAQSQAAMFKKLAAELLDGADKCSQEPYYIVQPFWSIMYNNKEAVSILIEEKKEKRKT